jgi:hypothetical protein
MGVIIKKLDEVQKDYGIIMDFWNDNTMFVAQMKNVDSKKYQNIVKK